DRRPDRAAAHRRGARDAARLSRLAPGHPGGQVRRAVRRAAAPPVHAAVDPVAAGPGAAHGRGRALVVPPGGRRAGRPAGVVRGPRLPGRLRRDRRRPDGGLRGVGGRDGLRPPDRGRRAVTRRHRGRPPERHHLLAAPGHAARSPGVRPAQRSRRPAAREPGRHHRGL
ncbi:MAG: Protein of unknown function DUF664, partial [uncultured Blastococcus sp.]